MHSSAFTCRAVLIATLTALFALAGCGSKAPEAGVDAHDAPGDSPPSRVTTKKSEWSVGGIVSAKTETTTTEPVYRQDVVVEKQAPPENRPAVQSGQLTAGDVDDLLNPDQYAAYAGRFLQAHGQGLAFVDTRTRIVVRVLDVRGKPVPFANIDVRRIGAPLHLVTAADGTASFYPRFDKVPESTNVSVSSRVGSAVRSIKLAGSRLVTISLGGSADAPSAMDLALVIDTTGSMGDEMEYLQAELEAILVRLKQNTPNLDLHIGLILYRDEGDDYVVRTSQLTGNIGSIRDLLAQQHAGGGGDLPEAMDQAISAAQSLQWRPNAAKAVLLVTDAPPHEEKLQMTFDAAQLLRSRGVQIIPVAASGVDDTAQYVLRSMAALSQGRYIFLTDDSGIGNSHAEPDVACYVVTRLDQLISRVLAGVATGQRIEPRREDIIRIVGTYDNGKCRTHSQD